MNTDLQKEYEPKGIVRNGMLLLSAPIALDFLNDCRERRVLVLGFDGFRLGPGTKIQPFLEHSIDLSLKQFRHLSYEEKMNTATRFIRERIGTDLVFEMVVDEPS